MSKTIQRPLACRDAHCGAMCSPADASFIGGPKECYKYERRDDLYMVKSISIDKVKQARKEIQKLRGCSCNCSDGIIDDVEDILDKLIESEE